MTHKYQRALVLLFAGLFCLQTVTGDAAACRCDNVPASDSPQAVPSCCSAHHAPGAPAMETPASGGCDDCIQTVVVSNSHRDSQRLRYAVAENVPTALQPVASATDVTRAASLAGYFCLPPPPSTVIRI